MSNVTLTIGGRSFTVACANGEEAHVRGLGRIIDAKVGALEGAAGQGETRMLLFAALMLADELGEREASASAAEPLAAIAERLENLASALEAAVGGD